MSTQQGKGLYKKFNVSRVDGRDLKGGDRENAEYFVLDLTYDEFAIPALQEYCRHAADKYPLMVAELRNLLASLKGTKCEPVIYWENLLGSTILIELGYDGQAREYVVSRISPSGTHICLTENESGLPCRGVWYHRDSITLIDVLHV